MLANPVKIKPMKAIKVDSPDIESRVEYIVEEINKGKRDPEVRKVVSQILSKKDNSGNWEIKERDWMGEVKAVYEFIRKNVRYTRDIEGVELFQRAGRTLELKVGDCDDMAILAGAILQNMGYPLLIRVISTNPQKVFEHVYLMVGVPPMGANSKYTAFDASREFGAGWELESGVTAKEDFEVYDINSILDEEGE